MLERLRLTDFKSFVDEEVALSPLTLLVGANASGKSNFLDAIRFLQGTARPQASLLEVLDGEEGKPGGWPGIRGGAREAARVGRSVFAIESTWRVSVPESTRRKEASRVGAAAGKRLQTTYRIACRTSPKVRLDQESLGHGLEEGSLLRSGKITLGNEEHAVFKFETLPGKEDTAETVGIVSWATSMLPMLSHAIQPEESFRNGREIENHASALHEGLQRIEPLEIRPHRMRRYGRRQAPLGEEGSNISGVLARLCEDTAEKQALVDWLSELCAPDLVDLDFIEVPEIGDVMAVFVEKGGRRITARSLSDGTLRFLGLLVALRTAAPGSVVLLEDIEAELHPTRIRLLVEYLEAATRERDLQIIATTHSPAE